MGTTPCQAHCSSFSPVTHSLAGTHTDTDTEDKKCHSQLKDDSPVREEEEVCETRPVHPYEDVRVVRDLQLRQERNIPERQTGSQTSIIFIM